MLPPSVDDVGLEAAAGWAEVEKPFHAPVNLERRNHKHLAHHGVVKRCCSTTGTEKEEARKVSERCGFKRKDVTVEQANNLSVGTPPLGPGRPAPSKA